MPTNIEKMEAQPVLQPGEPGYWKVWGASVRDLQAGDIFAWRAAREGSPVSEWLEVASSEAGRNGLTRHILTVDGHDIWLGCLCLVVIMRPSTRNILSPYCQ